MLFEYIASKFDAINYNGANSALDYQLIMRSKSIGEAEIDEVRETVPYMDGDYDFTGKFAPVSYRNRKITVSFKMFMKSENDLWQRKAEIVNWLTSKRGGDLTFDSMPAYTFKKCSCIVKSFKQDKRDTRYAILDIEITCNPYAEAVSREYTTLLSYSDIVTLYMRYGTGANAYFITDQTETKIELVRNSQGYYVTEGTLPKVPCLLVVNSLSNEGTAKYVGNTEKTLTFLKSVKISDSNYLRLYRFYPAIDGDTSSDGYIQYTSNISPSTIAGGTLYKGDRLDYDSAYPVVLNANGMALGNLTMSGSYVLETGLSYNGLTLTQTQPEEVLL